jgi:hypothetical protein
LKIAALDAHHDEHASIATGATVVFEHEAGVAAGR